MNTKAEAPGKATFPADLALPRGTGSPLCKYVFRCAKVKVKKLYLYVHGFQFYLKLEAFAVQHLRPTSCRR